MIEAHELSRRYGDFTAVEGITFSVQEGEIVGMLGPNGAGKTTTLRMITGFLPPTTGRIVVAGKDLSEDSRAARRDLGYLPEQVALYDEMRVGEYLAYRARIEGLSRVEERRAIPEALERCLLTGVEDQIVGTLSKGYRQRVGLATAILHRPKVLVLDEPTVGLDPKQIIAIRELIRELGRERTLLLSTHILSEVELLCDRLVIIDRGRIVAQGEPEALAREVLGEPVVEVELEGAGPEAGAVLEALDGVEAVRPGSPGRWSVESAPGADPRREIFRAAVEKGWVMLELTEQKPTLEDVFVHLTVRDVEPLEMPSEDGGTSREAARVGPAGDEPAEGEPPEDVSDDDEEAEVER